MSAIDLLFLGPVIFAALYSVAAFGCEMDERDVRGRASGSLWIGRSTPERLAEVAEGAVDPGGEEPSCNRQ